MCALFFFCDIFSIMTNEDKLKKIHSDFKKNFILNEIYNPKDIQEFQCYWRLKIDADKTEALMEDILIFIRGINGVTIVRTSDTTRRNENNVFSTKLYVKYTPQTFNSGIRLEEVYNFLEKEIRNFGPAVSLTRISPPPGELVTGKKQG